MSFSLETFPSAMGRKASVAFSIFSCCTIYFLHRRFKSHVSTSFNFESISEKRSKSKPKKSILYTRTGDAGTSSLFNGERRRKDDSIFHSLGATDELNAAIGLAREYCILADNGLDELLLDIQSRLLDVGAAIATPRDNSTDAKLLRTPFPSKCTQDIENATDELDSHLPRITTFIIPSGGLAAAHLHLARVVCRRAERTVIPLLLEHEVEPEIAKYLNRLSDFLYAAARYACYREGGKEAYWNPISKM